MTMDSPKLTSVLPSRPREFAWFDLWEELSACHHQLNEQLTSTAKQHGVRSDEAAVICLLGKQLATTASQRDLSRIVCISPAKMSGLLERLRERQLLSPNRDPNDRRRQVWQLTPMGRELCDSITQRLNENANHSGNFRQLSLVRNHWSDVRISRTVSLPQTSSSNHVVATGSDGQERAA